MNNENKLIKRLIWLYLILIVVEGAARKWGPGFLNYPLLIIRDPIVLMIYVLALARNVFPMNGYIIVMVGMSVVTFMTAIVMGHGDIRVAAYGVHYNYFHFPLMWVMGAVLDREDVKKMGVFLMIVLIPNTMLMVAQFNASPLDPLNKGVGEGLGGQLDGGMGKVRPSGFFSFITGNAMFVPLAACFAFLQFTEKRTLWWWLLLPVLVCVALSQFVSISRSMLLATVLVAVAAVLGLLRKGVFSGKLILLMFSIPIVVTVLYNFVPVFHESTVVFMDRWDRSTGEDQGGMEEAILDRFTGGLTNAFIYAGYTGFFGEGIGMGSNVGSRFLTGKITFMLAEEEWSRVVMEMGPLFGFIYIGWRVMAVLSMFAAATKRFFGHKDTMPAILFAAAALPVLQGQLAPPTMLGFAVFGGGMVFAACREREEDEEEEDEDEYDEDGYYIEPDPDDDDDDDADSDDEADDDDDDDVDLTGRRVSVLDDIEDVDRD